jgi:hypothetical protein
MDYPVLPTDNLYKFVALAGLAPFLASATYPASKIVELQMGIMEATTGNTKLTLDIDEIVDFADKLSHCFGPILSHLVKDKFAYRIVDKSTSLACS